MKEGCYHKDLGHAHSQTRRRLVPAYNSIVVKSLSREGERKEKGFENVRWSITSIKSISGTANLYCRPRPIKTCNLCPPPSTVRSVLLCLNAYEDSTDVYEEKRKERFIIFGVSSFQKGIFFPCKIIKDLIFSLRLFSLWKWLSSLKPS